MGKLTFHLIKKLIGVDIEQLQEDNNTLMIKTQQLSFDVKDANKEAAYKRTQLSEAQEELTKTQSELAQSQTATAGLQKEISALQEEISRLQNGVSDLQKEKETECDNLMHTNEQLADLRQQNETLTKEKEEAENRIKELEADVRKRSEQQTAQNEELNSVKAQLQQLQDAHRQLQAEHEEQSRTLKQRNEEAQNTLTEIENKLSEVQAQKEEAETDKQTIIGQLTELQKENAQLKEQLSALQEPEKEEEPQPAEPHEEAPAVQEQPTPEPQPEAPRQEEPETHPTDIVEAYQEMKAKLEEATLKFPYTRITCASDNRQYLFDSHTLGLKAELFVWGAEGKEMILDENHFIPYDEIGEIEGLDTMYSTEPIVHSNDEENDTAIAETLLAAICASRPVRVTYRDKNGRISEKNLYWLCFQPDDRRTIHLPYDRVFTDMFEEKIDPEHIVAMSAHNAEPRIFIIAQILSIQVFDCFFSNARGVKNIIEGMRTAIRHEQPEAAEVIYSTLPHRLKETPKVVSSLANTYLLQGKYEEAVKLYLSLQPDQIVEGKTNWADYNLREFDELIGRGIEPDAFMQLKDALKEEGWQQ